MNALVATVLTDFFSRECLEITKSGRECLDIQLGLKIGSNLDVDLGVDKEILKE